MKNSKRVSHQNWNKKSKNEDKKIELTLIVVALLFHCSSLLARYLYSFLSHSVFYNLYYPSFFFDLILNFFLLH